MRFDRHEFLWPYLRGDLLNASDPSEAERCFRIAARLRPKLALPRLRLAERFLEQRRFDDAETEFQAAIRIEPRSARALFGLGQLAFYRGDFSEAARCAEQSFAFDPGHRKTVELRQRVAHRLKDKASVERLQILLDSMPARELNWDDPYYENITQRSRSPGRLAATGTDLVEQGRLPEAVSAFEELVAADPANPQSHGLLAITLIKQREYARAAQILDAGLARHPQLAELHFHRGVAHFFMEQWAAAASEFKRAIELKPDFRDARYNLAQTLAKLDDRKQAIAEFREAIKIRPDVAASYAALGKLLNESGDRDAARAVLEAAAKLKPHDAAIKQSLKSPRNDEAK